MENKYTDLKLFSYSRWKGLMSIGILKKQFSIIVVKSLEIFGNTRSQVYNFFKEKTCLRTGNKWETSLSCTDRSINCQKLPLVPIHTCTTGAFIVRPNEKSQQRKLRGHTYNLLTSKCLFWELHGFLLFICVQ